MGAANFLIEYYSEQVQADIRAMPVLMRARYAGLIQRMEAFGPNLGEPHTKAFGSGLFELLHGFVKKSEKTPLRERRIAEKRMKEV